MVSVSRFLMCASSCAITPASSSRPRLCSRPRVTATALWCGIAAGGEGVGLVGLDQVDRRHRQLRALRQLLPPAVQLGRAGAGHRPRIVHAQHHLVRAPPGEDVRAERYSQRDQRPAASAQQIAHGQEQRRQRRQQQTRACDIHHPFPSGRPVTAQVVARRPAAKMPGPGRRACAPAFAAAKGGRTGSGDEHARARRRAQRSGADGAECPCHRRGSARAACPRPPGQDRDHADQAADHRPRPVARLLARRRRPLPRHPQGPRRGLRLHRARQPRGRDLQRHRRAGAGQSGRARLASR